MEQAVALLELTSIARGYRVADALVKKAPVRLLSMGVISPGKYLIVITGTVDAVEESYLAGLEVGSGWVIDHLFLPQPHPELVTALEHGTLSRPCGALGLIETFSAVSAVSSADCALKAASVHLLELHFEKHLGGKGYFVLSGVQHDVEAALEAAVRSLREQGLLVKQELIANPHLEFSARLAGD